ncbi:hypothetical protein GCM10028774_36370 [Spirosoma jeollabukense]
MINAEGTQQVWIAAGTYKPTTTTGPASRTISFSMKNGVSILGGFPASGDPVLAQRSPNSFTTILSGDIGVVGDNSDNSYHVIYNPASLSLTTTAVLDGVVVTAGNANGATEYDITAGGMYNDGSNGSRCSPTIRNCSFISNTGINGGGVANYAANNGTSNPQFTHCSFSANSSPYGFGGMGNLGGYYGNTGNCNPILTNCSFTNNSAKGGGGGLYNFNSNAQLTDCYFFQNFTSFLGDGAGGGLCGVSSHLRLINCNFVNNGATINGGGIGFIGGSSELINCSFVGNGAGLGSGGGLYIIAGPSQLINCSFIDNRAEEGGKAIQSENSSTTQLTNCVLWNNGGSRSLGGSGLSVSYSLLEPTLSGYTDNGHNITTTTTPFAGTATTQLAAGSPAINAGSTTAYQSADGPATDLAGNGRIQNGTIDMGAYEVSLPPDLSPLLYVTPSLAYSTTTGSVVVDVFEVNSAPTSGTITVYIAKSSLLSLSFDAGATSFLGRAVQNSLWSFDGTSNSDAYILTTTQPIGAGSKLSVGLTSTLTPGQTRGRVSVTATLVGGSGGEVTLTNNTDADQVEYFNK